MERNCGTFVASPLANLSRYFQQIFDRCFVNPFASVVAMPLHPARGNSFHSCGRTTMKKSWKSYSLPLVFPITSGMRISLPVDYLDWTLLHAQKLGIDISRMTIHQ